MAERLARGVASPPFRAGEEHVSLTASVGVALSGLGPAEGVWRKADMALSRAKEQGGSRVEVYAGTDGPAAGPLPGMPPGAGRPAGADPDVSAGAASGAPGQPQAAAR